MLSVGCIYIYRSSFKLFSRHILLVGRTGFFLYLTVKTISHKSTFFLPLFSPYFCYPYYLVTITFTLSPSPSHYHHHLHTITFTLTPSPSRYPHDPTTVPIPQYQCRFCYHSHCCRTLTATIFPYPTEACNASVGVLTCGRHRNGTAVIAPTPCSRKKASIINNTGLRACVCVLGSPYV